MRYCKYLSKENGNTLPRYAIVEQRAGILWATLPMQAPQEDLAARLAAPLAVNFQPTPLADLKLLPPVCPSKILCIGRNYREHAKEIGSDVPTEPVLFLKPPSALLAPNAIVCIPKISTRVDYEGELGIVISRSCRNIGHDEDVRPYIRGYVNVNDVTARDLQRSDAQLTRGKGFDTFCPVGPIVSDEIDPVGEGESGGDPVNVTTRLNGVVRQHGSTRDMVFPIAHLLRYITAYMTLEAGDLISTGTPGGVGSVQPRDTIQVEVDGLGILENKCAAE